MRRHAPRRRASASATCCFTSSKLSGVTDRNRSLLDERVLGLIARHLPAEPHTRAVLVRLADQAGDHFHHGGITLIEQALQLLRVARSYRLYVGPA